MDPAAYQDDIDAAQRLALDQVAVSAVAGDWSDADTGLAVQAVQTAYEASTSMWGYLGSFVVADIGESVQADVVEGFWEKLLAASATWTMDGADQLRDAWRAALEGNAAWTDGDTSQTPLDVAGNAAEAAASVADGAAEAAANGTLFPMVAVGVGIVIAVLLLVNAPPRIAR